MFFCGIHQPLTVYVAYNAVHVFGMMSIGHESYENRALAAVGLQCLIWLVLVMLAARCSREERRGDHAHGSHQVTKLFDKRFIFVKMGIIMTNYTNEAVVERLRPNPDLCKFISTSELASLAKEEPSLMLQQAVRLTTSLHWYAPRLDHASAGRRQHAGGRVRSLTRHHVGDPEEVRCCLVWLDLRHKGQGNAWAYFHVSTSPDVAHELMTVPCSTEPTRFGLPRLVTTWSQHVSLVAYTLHCIALSSQVGHLFTFAGRMKSKF